ncbi:MAG: STAS/SEC14 domain-containing protein [Ignavibacteriae bacterium]|nr:MAG: STAS/SEC14 domain-containing protein [Ignavibacteriota bacterium]
MPYTIDKNGGVIKVHYTGSLTDEDIRGVVSSSLDCGEIDTTDRIEDMRNLNSIHLGYKELAKITANLQNLQLPRIVKTAILTDNPLQFVFARMFQTILDHPQMKIEIFSDEAQACSWLSSGD